MDKPRSRSSESLKRRPRATSSCTDLEALNNNLMRFEPPFYNHPPTPLPISNSFSSLFTSGRRSPWTGASTPTGSAYGFQSASETDTDIPKGDQLAKASDVTVGGDAVPPAREYFGFALYVSATFAFLVYVMWALLPAWALHAAHIYYYPSRWWALAVPSLLVMAVVYTYVALASYNVEVLTPGLDRPQTVVDQFAVVTRDPALLWRSSDGVWDLPLEHVDRVLYGDESIS
ncbi:PIG-P-domain-containing protein [Dipodascopsis tothii]|uniref:PIG-P-domain-containing protein n=1 Tax=Dipodascopsis tothii TaxID=44089 RepID=UPI0034CEAA2E